MDFTDDRYCFACGPDNPAGLKLKFNHDKDSLTCSFTPLKIHQGFKDVVHGGIISTLLDEAMAYLCIGKGYYGVTGKLEVKFKKPALVGDNLKAYAAITEEKGKLVFGKARIENSKGEIVAEGTSTFIKVSESAKRG
ncbi:MAG: PaaI family thioesterase [Armatimonadota bacterium]